MPCTVLHPLIFLRLRQAVLALLLGVVVLPAGAAGPAAGQPAGDLIAGIMLAEIAAEREQVATAATMYFSLAQTWRHPLLARRATELAQQSRQPELARRAVRLWMEIDPDMPEAMKALAQSMSGNAARLDEIEPRLRRMLETETEPIAPLIATFPGLLSSHPDRRASLALVERLTQPYLQYPESHLARARMAFNAGDNPRAERAAQRALDLRPDLEDAARLRALAAPAARWPAAMEELGRYARRHPQAKGVREWHARWLVSVKRDAEALTAYRALLTDFPADDALTLRALNQWLRLAPREQPEPLIRRLLATQTGNQNALRLSLATLLEQRGDSEEALSLLRGITEPPGLFISSLRVLQILAASGRAEEARNLLVTARSREPGKEYLLVQLQAESLIANDQRAAALSLHEAYLAENPDQAELLLEASLLAERLGRHEDMERWTRRYIELRPFEAEGYNALGYSLADRNIRLDEAEQLLTRAIRLGPDSAAIIDSVGWLRFRQGRFKEAVEWLRRAQGMVADPEISSHLAEALWHNGQRAEARRVILEAERKDPDSPLIRNVKQRLFP